ncbi:MAG: ABC transporter permease [Oscillospiraceae bacterium]|nr:ABC transporter permease [Oscillospiraceae bacterium]
MEETAKSGFDIKEFIKGLPPAPFIIGGFWVIVLIVAAIIDMPWIWLISDSLQRAAIWGMLTLAMVPSIQSGTGPNFALPIGLCGGMFAMVAAIQFGFAGVYLLLVAAGIALVMGIIMGYLYGVLMNAVKGSEMAIATYTGFAVTTVFFIVWLTVPFDNPFLGWFLGEGLRNTIALDAVAASQVLDDFLKIELGRLTIPTGTILVFLAFCTLIWLFFRSKTGIAISAVGANPMFARAAGLNVDRSRIIANVISTSLASVGVVVYAQSFGFVQLYDFPLWMAFPAVAAVLVGGATAQRAKVIHVIIGVVLFQGLLTTVPPVFSQLLAGADMTDAARMVIQNAIILYALTKITGGGK